jgi:hypothetical protein
MTSHYKLEGKSIGSCGCKISLACFCWSKQGSSCGSFVAYHIVEGQVKGVNVSSLSLVRVVGESDEKSVLYIDSQGNPEQRSLLVQAFTGELGGILQDIHQVLPSHQAVKIAPISFLNETSRKATLRIGGITVQEKVEQKQFSFEL